jgi:hypothetical protein
MHFIKISDQLNKTFLIELSVRVFGDFGRVESEKVEQLTDDMFLIFIETFVVLRFNGRNLLSNIESA